ncbi:MAG: UDP-N-acetylmuramate--L-alanine ligase [Candidatus Omnitrophota bacterium]
MKKIHFIGIGGIGMSALASVYLSRGCKITGSDLRPNNLTDQLDQRGAVIYKGHSSSNIQKDVDLIVKSTCIDKENPEIKKGIVLGIPIISRGRMLEKIMKETALSIGITGTHGKTTTSSLIAHIAEHCGKDPTVIIGGETEKIQGNARSGKSGIIIAEVDESDGYFRNISTDCGVITNIEREHMEFYSSFDDLIGAYGDFISEISPDGLLVFNGEDERLKTLVSGIAKKKMSFGINGDFDVTCCRYSYKQAIEFDLIIKGSFSGRVSSSLAGKYNLMNILAALTVCTAGGYDLSRVIEGIKTFKGVRRRFDLIGTEGGVKVIEDYAHHPTELRCVLRAAKDFSGQGRVVAVFQPHKYTRTLDLMKDFAECFYSADILMLTDIYSADEKIGQKVNVRDLYRNIDKSRFKHTAIVEKADIPDRVLDISEYGDIVMVLGAGDIRDVSGRILKKLASH